MYTAIIISVLSLHRSRGTKKGRATRPASATLARARRYAICSCVSVQGSGRYVRSWNLPKLPQCDPWFDGFSQSAPKRHAYRYARARVKYTKHAHTSRNRIVGDGRSQSQFAEKCAPCRYVAASRRDPGPRTRRLREPGRAGARAAASASRSQPAGFVRIRPPRAARALPGRPGRRPGR